MIDGRDEYGAIDEVEALVRSAGEYVQVSQDLRPRVLEAARLESGERRARQGIRRAALTAALVAWLTTASVERLNAPDGFREVSLVAAQACAGAEAAPVGGEPGWALVEAYTELRRRQAEVLRL